MLRLPKVLSWMHQSLKLHLLKLKSMVTKSVETLSEDFCYPEETRNVFSEFSITTDESYDLWCKFTEIIDSFNGEKLEKL